MEYESIKKLINDVGNSKIASLEIDFPDGTKISMVKECKDSSSSEYRDCKKYEDNNEIKLALEADVQEDVNKENTNQEQGYKYIKSPMVGTFYSKPSPNEKSFVSTGDTINKGKTTCIIEAMKLMNEIESEFDGEVVEILKNDGDPVEFGENLIKIK